MSEVPKQVLEWLKESTRTFAPVALVSGAVLFAPFEFLQFFGLQEARVYLKPYFGFAFLASSGVIIGRAMHDIFIYAYKRLEYWFWWRGRVNRLRNLTNQEKEVLRAYIELGQRTISQNITNPPIATLLFEHVIVNTLRSTDPTNLPYEMNGWAWRYLHKHPQLLAVPVSAVNTSKQGIEHGRT